MCNLYRPNGIHCDRQSVELDNNDSFGSTSSLINRLFQKGHKKAFAKCFASSETVNRINRINRPKANNKLFDTVESRPLVHQQTAQTCQRRSQKQTCTTNQSHVEIGTSTTKTPAPNCNYRQHRETYIGNDDNHDCINNIDTNKIEWYIELASNCYRNGFQLHVNHLDECSKHPIVLQKKPVQAAVLRLPSLALLCRTLQPSAQSKQNERSAGAVSFAPDLVVCPSFESTAFAAHCDKQHYLRDLFSDETKCQRRHQLNSRENNRIYRDTHLLPNSESSSHRCNYHRTIDKSTTLATIDTATPIKRQPFETEQFNVLNAKNNMNSVAVDATNLQQNLQLSCQAIRYNYHNKNSTFYQEFEASGEPQTIAENNNYQQHWIGEKQNLTALSDADSGARPIATAKEDIINELIETFNSSFDVTDVNQIKLPQIILSDFSSDQPTPPTTPLFSNVQSTARTLSEHPTQLQEYQPSKPLHLPAN